MSSPWSYAGLLLMPILVCSGYWLGGWWNFITPGVCFIIHPLINIMLKEKKGNHNSYHHKSSYPVIAYRLVALLYVPVLLALTAWAVYKIGGSEKNAIQFTGLALSVGIVNGVIGFTLAHEFIHRYNRIEKTAGYLLLLNNCYMHYGIEHVWGHHVYACTPKDPHTAKTGESLYRYLPRAIYSTLLNAWEIEQKRSYRKKFFLSGSYNRIPLFMLLQFSLCVAIILFAGWKACLFFLLQCFIAIILLHIVNYLQHYGLLRNVTKPGRFERMGAHHSWNSGNRLPIINLFQLDNHADHHIHPTHPYETLHPLKDSPTHPTGYSGMVLLALIPPLWFYIVNKKAQTNLAG